MHSTLSTVGENREKVTSRAGPRVAVTETVAIPPKKKKKILERALWYERHLSPGDSIRYLCLITRAVVGCF
jgi:hypothetical protein